MPHRSLNNPLYGLTWVFYSFNLINITNYDNITDMHVLECYYKMFYSALDNMVDGIFN